MTTTDTRTGELGASRAPARPVTPPTSPLRVFGAVLRRDVYVTGKELPSFLAQTLIQPFFFLLVFVVVLGRSGLVSAQYGSIMLPGLVALNAMFAALQAVTLPLVFELSWTREIDDRLLAPMPVWAVAAEKVVFASLRGILASLLMIPIGLLMVDVDWPASGLLPALVMVVLGSLLGSAMGLTLGTAVPPRRINIIFAVVFAPLMFTGSVQYPWTTLGDLRWFQVISAINPLTYVSEGIRASLVPSVPHIPMWICVLVPVAAIALFSAVGGRLFMRRALDDVPEPRPDGVIVDYGGVLDDGPLVLGWARRARAAGVRTALFSGGHAVPDECADAFGIVLLGAVAGARKPSPDAFAGAARALGLSARRCVVVDDIPANVRGAVAAGAVGVLHADPESTLAELEILFGIA